MASISDLIHGTKPEVAPFLPTDPLAELNKLLSGEITSWPQIEQLSNLFQNYMLGAYEQAVPGFQEMLKQGAVDTNALLSEAQPLIEGQIPPDVMNEVYRSSAYQNLMASGATGGPSDAANTARNLGLTS